PRPWAGRPGLARLSKAVATMTRFSMSASPPVFARLTRPPAPCKVSLQASRQKSNRNPSCWRRLGPSVSGRPKVDDCRLPWYRSQLSTLNTLNISQNAVAAYLPPNRKILLTRRSVLLSTAARCELRGSGRSANGSESSWTLVVTLYGSGLRYDVIPASCTSIFRTRYDASTTRLCRRSLSSGPRSSSRSNGLVVPPVLRPVDVFDLVFESVYESPARAFA